MPDWMLRSVKTFVQAFFGVLVLELCLVLNGGFPADWPEFWGYMAPVTAAALSAAICAVWNILSERMRDIG